VRWLAHMTVPALPAEQVAATAVEWRRGDLWRGFHLEQRALVSELPSLRGRLGQIDQPTTILYGTWDLVARPAHAHRLALDLPNTRLVAARRAGHMLPQQRPGLVADEIARAAT